MISVSFFHVFIISYWENAPGGEVLSRFYRSGGWGFRTLFCTRGGEFAHQKIVRGDGEAWNWLIHKDNKCSKLCRYRWRPSSDQALCPSKCVPCVWLTGASLSAWFAWAQGTEENDTQWCDGQVATIDFDAPWHVSLAPVRPGDRLSSSMEHRDATCVQANAKLWEKHVFSNSCCYPRASTRSALFWCNHLK